MLLDNKKVKELFSKEYDEKNYRSEESNWEWDYDKLQKDFPTPFSNLSTDLSYTGVQIENILIAYCLGGEKWADALCDVEISEDVAESVLYAIKNGKSYEEMEDWIYKNLDFECLYEIETDEDFTKFDEWCREDKIEEILEMN